MHNSIPNEVHFEYAGEGVTFKSVADHDHILQDMQRRGSFYERDVLERVREAVRKRTTLGAAIDAGAFIGTHSVYFAKFCRLSPVLSFEANSDTFPTLLQNIDSNGLRNSIVALHMAVGAKPGYGYVIPGDAMNRGHSSVAFEIGSSDERVSVCRVDDAVAERLPENGNVALIKIDVEGAELDVLRGAQRTIAVHKPVLCIEVHTFRNLFSVMSLLRAHRYWITDCLGYSPTYIMETTGARPLRRLAVNWLWMIRAALSAKRRGLYTLVKHRLTRLAQKLSRDVQPST